MTTPVPRLGVGGYFSLELGPGRKLPWMSLAIGYQSARSAIAAAINAIKPRQVWVPYYVCDAVKSALKHCGVSVRMYPLSRTWGVPEDVVLESGDLLICVDYFGLTAGSVGEALDRFGDSNVLIDASQSLFYQARPGSMVVYSPRKFVGIPDSGFLVSKLNLPPPLIADESDSIRRCRHLLTRLSGRTSAGYSEFQIAEAVLESPEPIGVSNLTAKLMNSINFEEVAVRRAANYLEMSMQLTHHGFEVFPLAQSAVPLCCPVTNLQAPHFRRCLVEQQIFTPSYWPGLNLPQEDQVGHTLRDRTVYLPCDQRIGSSEIDLIVDSLVAARNSK